MRLDSRSALAITAICAFGLVAAFFRWGESRAISAVVVGVEGFELQYINSDARFSEGFFSLGYAIWTNYPYFTANGETYEAAGVGGALIRRGSARPARYVVRETIEATSENPLQLRKSKLAIIDKQTGEILASRSIRRGQVENDTGWEGQHAALFVRSVLVPTKSIDGPVGTKQYPQLPATVETLPPAPVSNAAQVSNCPASYAIDNSPHSRKLNTERWRFLPQSPLQAVVCDGDKIVVFSGIFPNLLFVDVLSTGGTLLFQSQVRMPAPLEARLVVVGGVSAHSSGVKFTAHFAKPDEQFKLFPLSAIRVQLGQST